MPAKPTWQEVADIAAKVDGAKPGMKGICLRGLPGWGEVLAPLTTVVNTFGGTWFDKDWNAQVDAPEFKEATKFYVDLVQQHGESGRAAGRLRRVPQQRRAEQDGDVVRRHVGRRLARGPRLPGQGQDGLRPGAGGQDQVLGLAVHLGVGHPEGEPRTEDAVEVHLLGLGQGVREAGRQDQTAGPPSRPASGPRPTPTPTTSRPPRRSPSRPRPRSRAPTRRTPASSRGRRSASSSSTSPSSPTWAPRSRRTSPRPSPARPAWTRRSTGGQPLAEKVAQKYKGK